MCLVVLFLPFIYSYPGILSQQQRLLSTGEGRERASGSTNLPVTAQVSSQSMRKLLTQTIAMAPAPCSCSASPSHQRLRVLALGRWLLAARAELRHQKCPLMQHHRRVPAGQQSDHSSTSGSTEGGGGCSVGLGHLLSPVRPFSPRAYF